mmetsp:Transcript_85189/g.237823  ORF Transcript_85189/g.237823 Transcript_85189/m.237823 type:complete len:314 (+) Transcript_85189:457-1398(+)
MVQQHRISTVNPDAERVRVLELLIRPPLKYLLHLQSDVQQYCWIIIEIDSVDRDHMVVGVTAVYDRVPLHGSLPLFLEPWQQPLQSFGHAHLQIARTSGHARHFLDVMHVEGVPHLADIAELRLVLCCETVQLSWPREVLFFGDEFDATPFARPVLGQARRTAVFREFFELGRSAPVDKHVPLHLDEPPASVDDHKRVFCPFFQHQRSLAVRRVEAEKVPELGVFAPNVTGRQTTKFHLLPGEVHPEEDEVNRRMVFPDHRGGALLVANAHGATLAHTWRWTLCSSGSAQALAKGHDGNDISQPPRTTASMVH